MQFNPMDIMKNFQELQKHLGDINSKMEEIFVTGASGGGMVEIDLNGRMDVQGVRIEKAIIKPENSEMIEDLVRSAFADAVEKVRGLLGSEVGGIVSSAAGKQ